MPNDILKSPIPNPANSSNSFPGPNHPSNMVLGARSSGETFSRPGHTGIQTVLKNKIQAAMKDRALTFSPLAWLKLRLFLHLDDVEVGFMAISAPANLLYIQDLAVLRQEVTCVTVSFSDVAVADHFDRCADAGISPERCGRIWVHTHPGTSPNPSSVDEQTFARVFGPSDWAIMAIVARGGDSYARLSFNTGPGGQMIIPIHVDWGRFSQDLMDREGKMDALISGWLDEYGQQIHPAVQRGLDFWGQNHAASTRPIGGDAIDRLDARDDPADSYDYSGLAEDYWELSHPNWAEEVGA